MHKDEALQRFVFMMEYRNLAPNTIHMYSWYLSNFLDYCSCEDVSVLSCHNAQQFIVHLKDRYAPMSLNAIISGIRYFYEVVLEKPLTRMQFPNIIYPQNEIFIFSNDQVRMLLASADIRLRAMIFLGIDAGLRVSEVAHLKVKDIDSKSSFKSIYIRNSKRNKSRKVPMSDSLHKILQEYWKVYRPDPNGYLFTGKDKSSHINQNYINNLFKNHLRSFDFYSDDIRFHNLRDTYATMMLRNGCNIFTLKKLLGHNSFSSTARYIKCDTSDLEEAPAISHEWGFSL